MNKNIIKVRRFHFPAIEEVNIFVANCENTGKAIVIDAGGWDERIRNYINDNQLSPEYLFITHNHYDHNGYLSSFSEEFSSIKIINAENTPAPEDGAEFTFGELSCRIHRVPGHTPDMIVIYTSGHLFTGDALFAGSVGGTKTEDAYFQQIDNIQTNILCFPDETIIHPGHGPDSTLELEKAFNPFL